MAAKKTTEKKETAPKKTVTIKTPKEVTVEVKEETIDAEELIASLPENEEGQIIGADMYADESLAGPDGEQGVVDIQELDVKKIEEAVTNVDTEIKDDSKKLEEAKAELEETLKPVEEIEEEVKEIESRQEEIQKIIETEPEKAEEIIEKELSKATKIKEKIEKIIKKPRESVTTWWNGMGYDF